MYIENNFQTSNYSTQSNNKTKETPTTGFQNELEKVDDKKSVKEEEKSLRELVEDIISLLKTGFTKDELEAIEKLKEQILNEIDKKRENGSVDNKEIERLINELEKMVNEFKKSRNGLVIKDADEIKKENKEEGSDSAISLDLQNIKEKLDELTEEIKELKKLKKTDNKHLNTQEELLLLQELKKA